MINTIPNNWKSLLSKELQSKYFVDLADIIENEYRNYTVFPPKDCIFKALQLTDYYNTKVCILGQDPYHGFNQAFGLAFSVQDKVKLPPSLVNIFKELSDDMGCVNPKSGQLSGWAKQGVLLLNTTLTVRQGKPQSHFGLGWESFTDAIISVLSKREQPLVFILWGASAIAKTKLIDCRHHIITSPHPSPLSAYRGFFGSKPFSKANLFLKAKGQKPIDWSDTAGTTPD